MLELSEEYNVSMSKVLTGVTANDSLYCRRFLFSALSLLNPLDTELESDLEACKLWVANNDAKFRDMSEKDIAHNELDVTLAAIEYFYEKNPEKLKFEVSYENFIRFWEKTESKKENYKKALLKAAESAKSMGFGRSSSLSKDGKLIKVTKSMAVFRSIEVLGLQKIIIKLNPDFMPHLVLLNRVFIGSGYTSFPVGELVGKKTVSSLIMAGFALRLFRKGKGVSQTYDFEIPRLRHLLCCEHKYPVYKDFRKYLIDKGISGVNADENGSFKMKVVGVKRNGRVVSSISFEITSEILNSKKQKSDKQKQFLKNLNKPPQTTNYHQNVKPKTKPLSDKNNPYLDLAKKMTNQSRR